MPKEQKFECQNCGWRGTIDELAPYKDMELRLEPGDTLPEGECPEDGCGAVCWPVPTRDERIAEKIKELAPDLIAFTRMIARFTPAGRDSEDDALTLNNLIRDAKRLVERTVPTVARNARIDQVATKDMVDSYRLGAIDACYIIDAKSRVHSILRFTNIPPRDMSRRLVRKAIKAAGPGCMWAAWRDDLKFEREYFITEATFDQASGKLVQTTYRPD